MMISLFNTRNCESLRAERACLFQSLLHTQLLEKGFGTAGWVTDRMNGWTEELSSCKILRRWGAKRWSDLLEWHQWAKAEPRNQGCSHCLLPPSAWDGLSRQPPRDKKCQKRLRWPLCSGSWPLQVFEWHDSNFLPLSGWETSSRRDGLTVARIPNPGKSSLWPATQLALASQTGCGGPWPCLWTDSTGPSRQHQAGHQDTATWARGTGTRDTPDRNLWAWLSHVSLTLPSNELPCSFIHSFQRLSYAKHAFALGSLRLVPFSCRLWLHSPIR